MTSLMWVNGNIVLRRTTNYYAEFRDETDRFNKKQEQALDKRMRVIRRQERVSTHTLLKTRYEAEQLRLSLRENKNRSLDLGEYDELKLHQKSQDYGRQSFAQNRTENASHTHARQISTISGTGTQTAATSDGGVKLPPIWGKNKMAARNKVHVYQPITSVARPQHRRPVNRSKLFVQCQSKALSMRALRSTKPSGLQELSASFDRTGNSASPSGSDSEYSGS